MKSLPSRNAIASPLHRRADAAARQCRRRAREDRIARFRAERVVKRRLDEAGRDDVHTNRLQFQRERLRQRLDPRTAAAMTDVPCAAGRSDSCPPVSTIEPVAGISGNAARIA